MKKRSNKSSLFLAISALALCLGVLAFGVYSAISASLNISGQLGFNVHNCLVQVSGQVKNVAQADSDSMMQRTDITIDKVLMGGETTTQNSLDLGNLYFYQGAKNGVTTVYDMVFELSFTNLSNFKIEANVTLNNLGEGVSLVDDAILYTTLPYSTVISANATTTITFAFRLDDPTNFDQDTLVDFDFTADFAEWQLVKYDETNDYYYIEMGTNPYRNNEPLRWISFASQQSDGSYDFFNKTNKPEVGGTYYFISELVLYTDSTNTYNYAGGVPFQNAYTSTSSSQAYVTGTSYQAQDYAVSNVRAYLNGETVYNSSTESSSVFSESGSQVSIVDYNILTSEIYLDYVTARPLSELYETSSLMTTTYNCGTEADKLWLLSYNQNTTSGDTDSEVDWVVDNYGLGGETTTYRTENGKTYGTQQAAWWLRSPASRAYFSWYVDVEEDLIDSIGTSKYPLGVRPAFQITIPGYYVNSDGNLATKMGHGTDADYTYTCEQSEYAIEWIAFAVKGENLGNSYSITDETTGDTWYSLNGVDMTNVDYTGKTFWFIQKYVTAGGYYDDTEEENQFVGQKFNASSSDGNDYDTSDIYEYLTGTYLTDTEILSTYLYNNITTRTVSEDYTVTSTTQNCSFSAKLWLISQAELGLLNGSAVSLGSTHATSPARASGIGNTAGGIYIPDASWWLRSPYSTYSNYALYFGNKGYFYGIGAAMLFGIRAAFEITIA